MAYTSAADIARRQALLANLRQGGPQGGYARNPFGALAQGLNAYTAKSEGRELEELQTANADLRKADMGKLVDHLRGVSARDGFKAEYDANITQGPVLPENQVESPQFEHPDVSDAYTSSVMAQELAKQKSLISAAGTAKLSNSPVWGKDADDKWVTMQTSNQGGALSIAPTPAGITLQRPQYDASLQGAISAAKAQGKGDVETALISDQSTPNAAAAAEKERRVTEVRTQAIIDQATPLAEAELIKQVASEFGKTLAGKHEIAETAVSAVKKINELIAHLESSDAITGMGADIIKGFERAKVLLGGNAKTASDTEILDVMMGSEVFPLIKTLGLGARGMDTPAEREFLRKVLTGEISLNKQTLLHMAKMRKGIAQGQVDKWNTMVDEGSADPFFSTTGRKKQKLGEVGGDVNDSDEALINEWLRSK